MRLFVVLVIWGVGRGRRLGLSAEELGKVRWARVFEGVWVRFGLRWLSRLGFSGNVG